MNPVILKALIISGGTIGLGVPSIYYGYPHIAKLVSPVSESEKQKSTEEGDKKAAGEQTQDLTKDTQSITISQVGQNPSEQTPKGDSANQGPAKNDDASVTDQGNTESEIKNPGTDGESGKTNTKQESVGNSGGEGPAALPAAGTPANVSAGQGNNGSQGGQG